MTFTFTMDAFPGYTIFDKTKKVLCVMQIVNADEEDLKIGTTIMGHTASEDFTEDDSDSTTDSTTTDESGEQTTP